MRVLLYCAQAYSVAVLEPLGLEAEKRGYEVVWFCPHSLAAKLPEGARVVHSHEEACDFKSDAIFVPGNDVPFYLRGIKTQIFHGFAGEKRGHFRIRGYFDLYLTQGPYFTQKFSDLKSRYRNFEVVETGWPKLDPYLNRKSLRNGLGGLPTLLYAPTFSRSLTSARILLEVIPELASLFNVVVKFHPLTPPDIVSDYQSVCGAHKSITITDEDDLCSLIVDADILLSDTSSAVYEAIILGRKVVTFRSVNKRTPWENVKLVGSLADALVRSAKEVLTPECEQLRLSYHPYTDGKSAARMMDAVEIYAEKHGVPECRSLSILRKLRWIDELNLWKY
jgi:CDP-ribitol ribitolphosphotransferase